MQSKERILYPVKNSPEYEEWERTFDTAMDIITYMKGFGFKAYNFCYSDYDNCLENYFENRYDRIVIRYYLKEISLYFKDMPGVYTYKNASELINDFKQPVDTTAVMTTAYESLSQADDSVRNIAVNRVNPSTILYTLTDRNKHTAGSYNYTLRCRASLTNGKLSMDLDCSDLDCVQYSRHIRTIKGGKSHKTITVPTYNVDSTARHVCQYIHDTCLWFVHELIQKKAESRLRIRIH